MRPNGLPNAHLSPLQCPALDVRQDAHGPPSLPRVLNWSFSCCKISGLPQLGNLQQDPEPCQRIGGVSVSLLKCGHHSVPRRGGNELRRERLHNDLESLGVECLQKLDDILLCTDPTQFANGRLLSPLDCGQRARRTRSPECSGCVEPGRQSQPEPPPSSYLRSLASLDPGSTHGIRSTYDTSQVYLAHCYRKESEQLTFLKLFRTARQHSR